MKFYHGIIKFYILLEIEIRCNQINDYLKLYSSNKNIVAQSDQRRSTLNHLTNSYERFFSITQ